MNQGTQEGFTGLSSKEIWMVYQTISWYQVQVLQIHFQWCEEKEEIFVPLKGNT